MPLVRNPDHLTYNMDAAARELLKHALGSKDTMHKLVDADGNEWELTLKRKASNVANTYDENSPHAKKVTKRLPKATKFKLDDILGVWRNTTTDQLLNFYTIGDKFVSDIRDDQESLKGEPWNFNDYYDELSVLDGDDDNAGGRAFKAFKSRSLIFQNNYSDPETFILTPIMDKDTVVGLNWYMSDDHINDDRDEDDFNDDDQVCFRSNKNRLNVFDHRGLFVRV